MNTDYQLWEIADLLRYSTQLSISKSLLYYKNKTQVQMLIESATIASGHLWRLSSKSYKNAILGLYCNISLDCDELEYIAKIHRKLFRSVTNSMKFPSLVQYFFALGNPIFLQFRLILINLIKVVSPRVEMCIKC
ncbi:hypothetical protein T11_1555 [Trichinella zimbabwensis]|uniref:Uncharacterized protein n=1 Tax=Trichinella zimbabwensis TaxID=268475 RepID=A0A0V1HXL2_9BILA|nr:hypothetical protein T11_1555 [Trichinella zimbabwensis]